MNILLIEDESLIAISMEDTLRDAGHHVVGIAADEKKALFIAEHTSPDLALVDFNLVGSRSGSFVVEELRRCFGIPSVFVSGNPADCHQNAHRSGPLGCLIKPFCSEDLLQTVDVAAAIIGGQRPSTSLPSNFLLYTLRA